MPDRDSAPWWEAVRRHELLVQKCLGCGTLRLPPCAICDACQCRDAAWVPAAGTGTVQSWIVSHHVFMRSMAAEAPYAVALVRLDDGDDLLLYGNIVAVHDSGGPGEVTQATARSPPLIQEPSRRECQCRPCLLTFTTTARS